MKTLFVLFALFIVGLAPVAAQQAEYVEYKLKVPRGPYFKVDQTLYRVKGAQEVGGLGSYGRVTGKGWLGPFVVNGYKAAGSLDVIPEMETRTATASGESIIEAALSGYLSGQVAGGDYIVDANGNYSIDVNSDYSVIVVRPKSWDEIFKKLNEEYARDDAVTRHSFQDSDFRIIDSIVYATNLKIEKIGSISGKAEGGFEGASIDVSANVEGGNNTESKFELTGKQIIAYSFRRLCWQGETIVGVREDDPGVDDVANCDQY